MHRTLDFWLTRPATATLWAASGASLLFNLAASAWLNTSYAASGYPVPYYVAQLSFSAERLKGWYAAMLQQGTLDLYLRTQHIDFVFIASTLLLHFFTLVLASRAFPAGSRGRRTMVAAAAVSAIAPMADAAENLVSYVMLAQPLGFPSWLALVYSSFSAVKFAFFCFAYLALPLGLLAAATHRARARRAGHAVKTERSLVRLH